MPPGLGIVSTDPPTRSTIAGSARAAIGAGLLLNPPNVQDVAGEADGDGDGDGDGDCEGDGDGDGDGATLLVALGDGTGVVRLKLNVPCWPLVSVNVPEIFLPSGETVPVKCAV